MDYTEYLSDPSPSSSDAIKLLVEQALWKYTSIFLAQPLEVAKTVLQVRAPGPSPKGTSQPVSGEDTRRRRVQHMRDIYKDNDVRLLLLVQEKAADRC